MITAKEYTTLKKLHKIPKISLDFYNDSYNCIPSKQMDHARYLEISLTEYGVFRPVREGEVPRIRLLKPDNTYVFNDCETLEDGKVLVTLNNNMLAAKGTASFDITISNISGEKGSDYLYSTKIGLIDVTATPYPSDAIESTHEFDTLTKLIVEEGKRIEDLKNLDELLTVNESIRQSNEVNRENAEKKRQEDTAEAIANANEATAGANTAAGSANTAATHANAATEAANEAAGRLNSIMDRYHFVVVSNTEPEALSVGDEWLLDY